MAFTAKQMVALRRTLALPDDAGPDAILAGVDRALTERAEPTAPGGGGTAQDELTAATEAVEAAVQSGKFGPARAEHYQRLAAAELRDTGTTARTRALLESMAPAADASSAPAHAGIWRRTEEGHMVPIASDPYGARADSSTPNLDALEEHIWGPSIEDRRQREALAAEAELSAQLERERESASTGKLTAAEERAIFGSTDE